MGAKNAMEIFTILDKSNCKKCGEKTCLAFAGAVFLGNRKIEDCPKLNNKQISSFKTAENDQRTSEDLLNEHILKQTKKIVSLDFEGVAKRIGVKVHSGVLTVPILGKNFGIRGDGSFQTDLHVIPWVVSPLLDYVLQCKGLPVSGEWISFREMKGGKEKYALFKKRGEDVLLQLADKYTDFFNDIVYMFNGKTVEKRFEADVSVVLYPFPLVPIMICYWKPEDGLVSSLNLFYDKTVDENLGIDAAFSLGTGLAQMFEKLAEHHGF